MIEKSKVIGRLEILQIDLKIALDLAKKGKDNTKVLNESMQSLQEFKSDLKN